MPSTTRNTGPGQQAANRRFPLDAELIDELTVRSESFRSICEDLAEAERALAATDTLPENVRLDRRAESEEWVASLTNEIESMLYLAKVVPIDKHKPSQ